VKSFDEEESVETSRTISRHSPGDCGDSDFGNVVGFLAALEKMLATLRTDRWNWGLLVFLISWAMRRAPLASGDVWAGSHSVRSSKTRS